MASNNNIAMYQSWKDCYQKKGEEDNDWNHQLSDFDDFPSDYLLNPDALKLCIDQYQYKNIIIIPAGSYLVRCVHSCFMFEGDAVGISGSRRSPPFKSLRTDQIVKAFMEPRATRSLDEAWIPSVEEFRDCDDADDFKTSSSLSKAKEGPPNRISGEEPNPLGSTPQSSSSWTSIALNALETSLSE